MKNDHSPETTDHRIDKWQSTKKYFTVPINRNKHRNTKGKRKVSQRKEIENFLKSQNLTQCERCLNVIDPKEIIIIKCKGNKTNANAESIICPTCYIKYYKTHPEHYYLKPDTYSTCKDCNGNGAIIWSCCGDDITNQFPENDICPTCGEHFGDDKDDCKECKGTGINLLISSCGH